MSIELGDVPRASSTTPAKTPRSPWSPSVVWITSARDIFDVNHHTNPARGLRCLFITVSVIILSCLFLAAAFDAYMLDMRISLGTEGTVFWRFGWLNAVFRQPKGATCDPVCLYDDFTEEEWESRLPIPSSRMYAKNAGRLLIGSVVIILFWILYLLYVLCERKSSHEALYIKCCKCIKIPERPTIYFAFSVINKMVIFCIVYYVMLCIYAFMESDFYLTMNIPSCINRDTTEFACLVYPTPHFGFCVLFLMLFLMAFCAFRKTEELDEEFNERALKDYYPEHLEKAKNHPITLKYVFKCFASIKMICIASFIMCFALRDVGFITMIFQQDTETSYNLFPEFEGLANDEGVIKNSYINTLNEGVVVGNSTLSPIQPYTFEEESAAFESIALYWDWWVYFICFVNMLLVAPYLIVVIERYESNKCMKTAILGITFVEWLIHTGLMALYYYEFATFFSNDAKAVLEKDLLTVDNIEFKVSWYPDWGIIVAFVLWIYLLRLMWAASKGL